MMRLFKKNYKVIIGIIIGIIISSIGIYAATTIVGENITYSNTKSGLTSTNVQGAIDELYEKSDIRKSGKFVAAYTYNKSGENKCITGEESTCKKTTCYKNKTANSCPSGTIILYKVNDLTIVPFHVMFDEGATMTMQSQKNIMVNNTNWDQSKSETFSGPLTLLDKLATLTADWNNTNDQTYTLGTTVFKTNAYTHCNIYNSCSSNLYSLPERTNKARMITLQELVALGCTDQISTCPTWMQNKESFWTMNTASNNIAWVYFYRGFYQISKETIEDFKCTATGSSANCPGVRAVVVVSK